MELNRHFERLLHETDVFGDEAFLGAVKRHGLMAYRLCMIFTALEAASLDYGVDKQYCNAVHFRAALAIVDVCLEHSRLLMTQLKASDETPELTCPDYFRQLFDRLPAEFNLSDLYALTQATAPSAATSPVWNRSTSPACLPASIAKRLPPPPEIVAVSFLSFCVLLVCLSLFYSVLPFRVACNRV